MTTKNQEHNQLNAALCAIGADTSTWKVTQADRERPDFVVSTPDGDIGLELTEILLDVQGEHRAGEQKFTAVIRDVVREHLVAQGGSGGGHIDGNASRITSGPHKLDIPVVIQELRDHLATHGADLAKDGGFMDVRFDCAWGSISDIQRRDSHPELMMMDDHRAPLPTYKQGRRQEDIEDLVIARIKKKVDLAAGYEKNWQLWLALRNPNQRLAELSQPCLTRARTTNAGCFERIFLYNDLEDVLDARPPGPPFLDLLPWPPTKTEPSK